MTPIGRRRRIGTCYAFIFGGFDLSKTANLQYALVVMDVGWFQAFCMAVVGAADGPLLRFPENLFELVGVTRGS